jgi:ComF family protein
VARLTLPTAQLNAALFARWRAPLRRSLIATLDLAFPPDCGFCHAAIDSSKLGLLCTTCRQELLSGPAACPRCGRASSGLSREEANEESCSRCAGLRYPFERTLRLAAYEGAMRSAVLRAKRSGERELTMALGELLAEQMVPMLAPWQPHAVLAVPMHWTRRVRRGVNSPQILARALAAKLGVPVADHVLVRSRRTAPQASLSTRERTQNVRGAFQARRHRDLKGARLVLVDDVMTTGATVKEAAKSLRRAGAEAIHVVVLARAEELD